MNLADRCGKLGGSDIASLFGCGFATPEQLFADKLRERETGEVVETPMNFTMRRGVVLERPTLEAWAAANNVDLCFPDTHEEPLPINDYDWATGHLDAWYYREDGQLVVVDAKAPLRYSYGKWENEVPHRYVYQMQFYMHRYAAAEAVLAVDVALPEPIDYRLVPDATMVAEMLSRAEDFMWCVTMGTPWTMPGEAVADPEVERAAVIEAQPSDPIGTAALEWAQAQSESKAAEARKAAAWAVLNDLLPVDAARVSVGGVPVLRVQTRQGASLDKDTLERDYPGLLERYERPGKLSTFPVAIARKGAK